MALRLAGGDSTSLALSNDYGQLANAVGGAGDLDSARALAERRLRLERERDPPIPSALSDASSGAALALEHAEPLQALELQQEAVHILQPTGGLAFAGALRMLADRYRVTGRYDESERRAREALALFDSLAGPDQPGTAMARHTLGQTLAVRGDHAGAARLLEQSLRVFEREMGTEHPFTLSMRNNLGVALLGAREPAAAETVFRTLVAARRGFNGERHPEVAGALQNLAAALLAQHRYEEAERLTREAEALYRAVLPAGSIVVTFPMLTRSEIQLARGDFVAARRTAGAVRAALEGRLPPAHPAVLVADCRLGRALAGLGDTVRARALLDRVAAGMSAAEGVRAEHRSECLGALAGLR